MVFCLFLTDPKSTMIEFYDRFNEPPFTFAKFFEYIQEDPVLAEKDQSTFATLFEIYCKKLAGILPSVPSQPPPQSMISCQSDDSESTESSGNRRRDRRPRRKNRKYLLSIIFYNNHYCKCSYYSCQRRKIFSIRCNW